MSASDSEADTVQLCEVNASKKHALMNVNYILSRFEIIPIALQHFNNIFPNVVSGLTPFLGTAECVIIAKLSIYII